MSNDEILQEISGLLGAIDGKILERVKRIIQYHTVGNWYSMRINVLLDRLTEPKENWINQDETLESMQKWTKDERIKIEEKYKRSLKDIDNATINHPKQGREE